MINLIPQSARKKLQLEYWSRVLTVSFVLWSMAFVVGTIMLLPAYGLISYQISSVENTSSEAAEKVTDYDNVVRSLEHASQQARMIVDEDEALPFSELVELFEISQGSNISLSNVEMERSGEEINQIMVNGVAADRVSLATYRDQLLTDKRIESVEFPISNLAQDKDIDFTLTIVLHKPSEL